MSKLDGIGRSTRNGSLAVNPLKHGPLSGRDLKYYKSLNQFERLRAVIVFEACAKQLRRIKDPEPLVENSVINYGTDSEPDALVLRKGKLFLVTRMGSRPCTLKQSIAWRIRKQRNNDGSTSTHADEITWFKMLRAALA